MIDCLGVRTVYKCLAVECQRGACPQAFLGLWLISWVVSSGCPCIHMLPLKAIQGNPPNFHRPEK
jgi:hypothetical protein